MLTCNDLPVLVLGLTLPRAGVWVADVQVDADEAVTGAVVLADADGRELNGTVYRSRLHVGRVHARILGGAGKLTTAALAAKSYQSASARLVIEDAIADAGEVIDPNSDTLSTTLDYWTRAGSTPSRTATASLALAQLADKLGFRWRILPNGKVWVGADGSDSVATSEAIELNRDGAAAAVYLGLDGFALLPGDIFNGERVGRIRYTQSDSDPLRATFWPEAA
jgi:hypothetical protein